MYREQIGNIQDVHMHIFSYKRFWMNAPQQCLYTSRVGINVTDVNKKVGRKLMKPPCNWYSGAYELQIPAKKKVIAYPDGWYPA